MAKRSSETPELPIETMTTMPSARTACGNPADAESVACHIVCDRRDRKEEAERRFSDMYDPDLRGVLLKNAACGGNVFFAAPSRFPTTNMRCTCGRPNHWFVLWENKRD